LEIKRRGGIPTKHLAQPLIPVVTRGATELFPISGVGHGVIIPYLLHWSYNPTALLPFMVMLHLGTAFALFLYFDLAAGIVAYLSVSFLMRYFRKREVEALRPFAYYCLLVGLAAFLKTVFSLEVLIYELSTVVSGPIAQAGRKAPSQSGCTLAENCLI